MSRPKPPLASPDEIEQQFYEAMQRADIELMMSVWSDEDEISCVHPGGARAVGPAAIRASFEAIFGHNAVDVTPERVRRLHSHACAVHSVIERVQITAGQGPQVGYIFATNVYLKTAAGWRMVVHHATPGSLQEVQEGEDSPSTLH